MEAKIIKKCKHCKENFVSYKKKERKFCSMDCRNNYWRTHKMDFFGSEFHHKGNRVSNQIQRKNKTNCFFNPESRKEQSEKGVEVNKKNKTFSFYNPKIARKAGQRSAEVSRGKKNHIFNSIIFDSKSEMEIGMCIHHQIEKLKEGINYQKKVGSYSFDFFVDGVFIEYHPIIKFFHPNENSRNYYDKRRKILNINGYNNFLVIIK